MRPAIEHGKRTKRMGISLSETHFFIAKRNGGSGWVRQLIEKAINETNVQPRMASVSDVPVVNAAIGR